jgi:hypothetical protein
LLAAVLAGTAQAGGIPARAIGVWSTRLLRPCGTSASSGTALGPARAGKHTTRQRARSSPAPRSGVLGTHAAGSPTASGYGEAGALPATAGDSTATPAPSSGQTGSVAPRERVAAARAFATLAAVSPTAAGYGEAGALPARERARRPVSSARRFDDCNREAGRERDAVEPTVAVGGWLPLEPLQTGLLLLALAGLLLVALARRRRQA